MIYIDKTSKTPYYIQIYEQIIRDITDGKLKAGQLLPGSRALSRQVGVGRNTVNNAFAQLAAEGYIVSKKGAGFEVQDVPILGFKEPEKEPVKKANSPSEPSVKYDLFYGNLSSEMFPYALWRRYAIEALSSQDNPFINCYQDKQGDYFFREQLADYLHESRGVRCAPEQIVITCGQQNALDIVCKMLYGDGGVHGMEDPGYDKAVSVFQNNRIPVHFIPVDDCGVIPSSLPNSADIKALSLTPSHQLPMGSVMPIKRRYEILNWAKENKAFLLEDDYDSEYSYYTNPVPSLQSIDRDDQVIYLGTFSKTLSPSMRLGYMVLPRQLMQCFQEKLRQYNCPVPWLNQYIVGRLIENGHYGRLIRKLRTSIRKKHDLLMQEISKMNGQVKILSHGAGLNFLLEIQGKGSSEELVKAAGEKGVKVYSPRRFWQNKDAYPPHLVFIGFASIDIGDIPKCIELLDAAWFQAKPKERA